MLVGMQDFDVEDWEKHTMYKNYAKNAKQVQWFWQVSLLHASHTAQSCCLGSACGMCNMHELSAHCVGDVCSEGVGCVQ